MKQRILLVNKFYYRRGGDCVCVLNLEKLLSDNGHEVAVFAMHHPENLPSPWSRYWASPVDFSGPLSHKLTALQRTLGMGDIKSSFARILREFRPDVVHLHNIHSYLSPVLGQMARKAGIPVVWTLHDYKLLCPSYACLRNGVPCELCYADKRNVISNRCMKASLAASAVAYAEALKWSVRKLCGFTSAFICPSHFMARKMEQGHFPPDRITTLCNFISPVVADDFRRRLARGLAATRQPYYCYIGRLSPEKGVATLLEAAAALPYELRVAGTGPLEAELKSRFGHLPNIRFLGHLDAEQVADLLASAKFSVLPSEWYENNPLGVIESLCAGTPVIGAAIGGIPELISPSTGLTFTSGSIPELKEAIATLWDATFNYEAIASESLSRFSAMSHYRDLMEIYAKAARNY